MKEAKKTQFELEVVGIVKQWREKLGYTQESIALVLNVSKGFIGQIESPENPSTYSLNHLNILAKEFECSPRELMPEKSL